MAVALGGAREGALVRVPMAAVASAWQATPLTVIALLVGLPAGVALGRLLWVSFADQLGVAVRPVVPPLAVARRRPAGDPDRRSGSLRAAALRRDSGEQARRPSQAVLREAAKLVGPSGFEPGALGCGRGVVRYRHRYGEGVEVNEPTSDPGMGSSGRLAWLRTGSLAVLATAVVVAITALREQGPSTALHQTDIREGFAPWALVLFCCAMTVLALAVIRTVLLSSRWTRLATLLLPAGLAGAAFFFLTLGASHFAPRLANAESPLGTIGTLVGSITIVLLLPAGLLLFALALVESHDLSAVGRWTATVSVVVAVVGGAVFAAAPERDESAVIAVVLLTLGGLWCALGFAVAATASSGLRSRRSASR